MIFLSGDNECHTVTAASSIETIWLKSNQEEADTKVILHNLHVLRNSELSVVLRSPSGDTDIMVLALGIITEHEYTLIMAVETIEKELCLMLSS